jgi:predicted GIY-YIG superfamily endonuclease
MVMPYFVYILASRYKGTLYVGVTNDLARRIGEHKGGFVPGFTKTYKSTDSSTTRNMTQSMKPARASTR